MEIIVTTRHIEMTDSIRQYAEEKAGKLLRYFDRIQAIEVVIDKVHHDYEVEMIVDAEHHDDFVAKHKGDDLYGCIDMVVEKLERQLTDHKEKLRNRKHNV